MRNDREIESPYIKEAIRLIGYEMVMKDLSGGVFLMDEHELGWLYKLPSSWNAFTEDVELPLGFRLRARQEELGKERAKFLLDNSAFVMGGMVRFGDQTRIWGRDLIKLCAKSGMHITVEPYNIPRLDGVDLRKQK